MATNMKPAAALFVLMVLIGIIIATIVAAAVAIGKLTGSSSSTSSSNNTSNNNNNSGSGTSSASNGSNTSGTSTTSAAASDSSAASTPSTTSSAATTTTTPAADNTSLVKQLVEDEYQSMLGRAADSSGETYWIGLVQKTFGTTSTNKTEIKNWLDARFKDTAEYKTYQVGKMVDNAYQTLLNRSADSSGKTYWVSEVIKQLDSNGNDMNAAQSWLTAQIKATSEYKTGVKTASYTPVRVAMVYGY